MSPRDQLRIAGPTAIPVPRVLVVPPGAGESDRLVDWLDAWPAGSMARMDVASARLARDNGRIDVVVGVNSRRTKRAARDARVQAIVLPSESPLRVVGARCARSPTSDSHLLVARDPETLYLMLDRLFIEPDVYRVDQPLRAP